MNNKIIRATLDDTTLIAKLGAKTFGQAFRGTCTDEDLAGVLKEYYNEEQVAKELANPEDYFFILYHNQDAVGYSRITLSDKPESHFADKKSAELKRIYFLEEFHGKGLAQILMKYCLSFLKEKAYEQVYLSVWEHNLRAQAFYKKHGFINTEINNPFPLGETPQMDYWFLKKL